MNTITYLTLFLKPWKIRVLGAIILGAGTILAGIGLMGTSGYLISASALRPPILDLMVVFVAVRFFGISRAVLRYSERLLSHDITFRILQKMRSRFFQVLSKLPSSRLMGYRSGSLLASISADIDELQNFYIRIVTPGIIAVLVTVVTTYFLYQFSPSAAITTLIFLGLSGTIIPAAIRKLARGWGARQVVLRSKMHDIWIEMTQNIEEIRLFGLFHSKRRQFGEVTNEISRLEQRQAGISGLQDALFNWLMYASVFIALLVTAPSVLDGDLSGVLLAMLLLAIMSSFEATQNLGLAFQYFESTEKSVANLNRLTDQDVQGDENGTTPSGHFRSLEFRNVRFAYEDKEIIEDINFELPDQAKVAIVGPSGSGKSTMVNLILRFYEPVNGHIFLNRQDIRDLRPDAIRNGISVVDPSTYLFNDSLRNNLLIAAPDTSDQTLINALQMVESGSWFRSLQTGLDTIIGEHGKTISGGELQRIALARAMLKNTSLWILDEPTANLDTITERALIRTIRETVRDKTAMWITHRLVEMDYFDRILVLQNGRIAEDGNHQSLIRSGGWYSQMLKFQNDVLIH